MDIYYNVMSTNLANEIHCINFMPIEGRGPSLSVNIRIYM